MRTSYFFQDCIKPLSSKIEIVYMKSFIKCSCYIRDRTLYMSIWNGIIFSKKLWLYKYSTNLSKVPVKDGQVEDEITNESNLHRWGQSFAACWGLRGFAHTHALLFDVVGAQKIHVHIFVQSLIDRWPSDWRIIVVRCYFASFAGDGSGKCETSSCDALHNLRYGQRWFNFLNDYQIKLRNI